MRLRKNEEEKYEWQLIDWVCDDFISFKKEKDLHVIAVSQKKYSYRKNAFYAAKQYSIELNISLYDEETGIISKFLKVGA
jgi:3-methyladenine DNA glycosylase AlkD